jgi:hypothetical protein
MNDTRISLILSFDKGYRISNNEILSPRSKINGWIDNKGYRKFSIRDGYKIKHISVHRLVAYQKYGEEIFKEGIQVRHLDGNPLNNEESNIVIGTPFDNMMDKLPETRMKSALIATSFIKVHNHKDILDYRKSGASYSEIMKKFNISSKGTLSWIINKSRGLNKED